MGTKEEKAELPPPPPPKPKVYELDSFNKVDTELKKL